MIYKEMSGHTFAYELSGNKDNGFSYEGALLLFDYLDESGEDIEFDPVALRCDYSEYTKEELVKEYAYSADAEECEDEEEKEEAVMQYIRDSTLLLEHTSEDLYILLDF